MRFSPLLPCLVSLVFAACTRDATPRAADASPESVPSSSSANGVLAPTVPRDSISERADRGRIMGDSTAAVWVIMASDFQCPYCKTWHDAQFAGLMENYAMKNRVRMAFINFPLSMHANAMPASEAAMCASVQGKFWPMHESLFATQKKWETMRDATPLFDSLATAAGVNMKPYRQCVSQHLTVPLIEADRERARQSGVGSTPTFFVGSQQLVGADADVRGAIEAALAKARGAKKPDN